LVFSRHHGLPPAIILEPQYSEHVPLCEAELFGNCGCIVILRTSYNNTVSIRDINNERPLEILPKCKIGRPSLLNCLPSATLLLLCLGLT
jgi:hypothetical protein